MTIGVVSALISALLWAWASTRFQPLVQRHGSLACNLFKTLIGTSLFWLLTLALLAGDSVFEGMGDQEATLLLVSGFLGMALGDWAYFISIHRVGVRQATLLHGTTPVFLLAANLLGVGRTLGILQIVGVLLVVIGVLDVTRRRAGRSPDASPAHFRSGILFGLLAAIAQATGIIVAADPASRCHAAPVSALRLSGAAVGLLGIAIVSGQLRPALVFFRDRESRTRALEPVLVGTVVGVLFMTVAIARADPAIAGTLLSLTPVFAIPVSRLLLREAIHPATLVGTAVACVGVALIAAQL